MSVSLITSAPRTPALIRHEIGAQTLRCVTHAYYGAEHDRCMAKKKGSAGEVLKGTVVQGESADWEALENVISYHACDEFMWMFEVELEDGTRLHAYKHRWNRRYLHLSARGEAFTYIWRADDEDFDPNAPGEYERVQLHRLLAAVLGQPRWPEVEDAEARRLAWERTDQPFNGVGLTDDEAWS